MTEDAARSETSPEGGANKAAHGADGRNVSEVYAYGGLAALASVVERLPGGPESVEGASDAVRGRFAEVLLDTAAVGWTPKSFPGLAQKMLWRDEESGASIALVRFAAGSGIPAPHAHASNQFMFCLSGRYVYVPTGFTLVQGSFYWNPRGAMHGPTLAQEESVLLEIYDGPHYPTMPEWYSDPEDAR